jgi:glutathione S-transferase
VVRHGLDAPLVVDALAQQLKLIERIEAATAGTPFLAGASYSLADAAATPYIWRLDKLKLARTNGPLSPSGTIGSGNGHRSRPRSKAG